MSAPAGTSTFAMAWRQLRRDLAAGEIRILLAALVLAVLAVSAVGFVTDRAERALVQEANRLLGGDAVVRADNPIEGAVRAAARAPGLRAADTLEMPSMIGVGEGDDARLQLGELHALGEGFPLRGAFRISGADGVERDADGVPGRGTLWMTRAGAERMGARIGDTVTIGESRLRLAALVAQEPDGAMDYFNVAPRVFLNIADVAATGLVQEGSRIGYRLVVAGTPAAVETFTAFVRDNPQRGQRLQTIRDGRPEVRSALDRAGRFLGLAALISVVLAAVAVAMAARRHSARHLAGAAVMRCLGASQRRIAAVYLGELLLLGAIASAIGVAVAFGLQWGVGEWLAQEMGIAIPAASVWPALQGFGVGLVVLLAFGAPPVLALRRVPALRVLRRDLDPTEPSAWIVLAAGIGGLAALLWWQAGSPVLAVAMLGGIAATLGVLALLAWALIVLVRRSRSRLKGALRYGLANVSRRAATSVAQVAALGLGLMALLLLTFVHGDLLDRWQVSLNGNVPNRFIVNVQPDQVEPMREFIQTAGLDAPQLYPMIRGRLVEHNGKPVSGRTYAPPQGGMGGGGGEGEGRSRAQRLAEREFNLSSAETLRDDNEVTAGRIWSGPTRTPEVSVEDGFAEALGWKLGDRIAFDIAGQRFEATITSLRKVDWESFRPNFFVVASPGALDDYPASYITAMHVPPSAPRFTTQLVQRFPNLTVIDVEAILKQVRQTADQVRTVVQVVFWFALAAGVLVLLAAISASQDERLQEGGVMRVLGGSRRQLRAAQASEFAAIGLLAGLVAAIAASVLAGVIATQVFDIPWEPNILMAVVGGAVGMLAATVAGLAATRRVVDVAPAVTLRELDA